MSQRWLWVTPRISSTLATGALRYSYDLASAVASQGVSVTMVGVADPADPAPTGSDLVYERVVGRFRPPWRSLLSALPNQAFACRIDPFVSKVRSLLETQSWDVVVIDGLQVAWMESELHRVGSSTVRVLVTHNHETTMRREIARAQPWTRPRRLLLEVEARKTARLERRMLAASDVVTSITPSDRARFEHDAPSASHIVVRPGWSGTAPNPAVPLADRPRRVGIMGSFEWHAKQAGLRTFLAAADPIFAGAGVELVVGGRMPDAFRDEIEPSLRATKIVGWVDNPDRFLSSCRVGVVAESLGGGFKLKALDYIFNGVPVAALEHSAAGLDLVDGQSILLAPDDVALGEGIVAVIDDVGRLASVASVALADASQRFSWPRSAHALVDAARSVAR